MYAKTITILMAVLALTAAEADDKKQTKRGIFGESFATGYDSLSYANSYGLYPGFANPITVTNNVAVPYAVPVVKHVAVPVDRPYPVHHAVPYPVYKTIAVPYVKPVAVPYVKHVAYPVPYGSNPLW